tara:strand:+ start:2211 stop:2645 length:435 start_codon:yes stop_codon:yes gene_type:complete
MTKIYTVRTFIISIVILSSPAYSLTDKELDDVLAAIRTVESNNNPNAVGDNGNAIGVYQIWPSYWKDAVEHSKLQGKYVDCYDHSYSDSIVRSYMKRYATKRRLGREPTQEDIARIHNGGPNGYKKKSTIEYWNKVKRILNKER